MSEDTIELYGRMLAHRENIRFIDDQRKKLRRRAKRWSRLLIASLTGVVICSAILWVQSHPKAPTYSYEDRQALDQLVNSLR